MATVILFPLSRRIGRVRMIADQLERLLEEHWPERFLHHTWDIRAELVAAGIGCDEIDQQIPAFARAVERELEQRHVRRSQNG